MLASENEEGDENYDEDETELATVSVFLNVAAGKGYDTRITSRVLRFVFHPAPVRRPAGSILVGVREEKDLSLLGHPACWTSGLLASFPPQWPCKPNTVLSVCEEWEQRQTSDTRGRNPLLNMTAEWGHKSGGMCPCAEGVHRHGKTVRMAWPSKMRLRVTWS